MVQQMMFYTIAREQRSTPRSGVAQEEESLQAEFNASLSQIAADLPGAARLIPSP